MSLAIRLELHINGEFVKGNNMGVCCSVEDGIKTLKSLYGLKYTKREWKILYFNTAGTFKKIVAKSENATNFVIIPSKMNKFV